MDQETVQAISAISGIATTVGMIFAVIGLVLVWLQVRHAVLARETSICLGLAQFSGSSEMNSALKRMRERQPGQPMSEPDRDSAIQVCVFFELIGAICNHGYMSTTLIQEFYGSLVIDTHRQLADFITQHRANTRNKHFAVNFEVLAKRLAPTNA